MNVPEYKQPGPILKTYFHLKNIKITIFKIDLYYLSQAPIPLERVGVRLKEAMN